jgi:glycosyltransferase involved in cell wall biosynthesis
VSGREGTSEHFEVVYVVARLSVGGPARRLGLLGSRMQPAFSSVLLSGVPEPHEGSLIEEIRESGAAVVEVPGLRRRISPLDDLRALWWLYRFFRRTRPLIVSTHTAKAGALGRVAALAARIPVRVHTFHGHVLVGYFNPLYSAVFKWIERALALVTTRVIAVSPGVEADLRRLGIAGDRLAVVLPGFDLDGVTGGTGGALRAELGVPAGAPLVGIVGRLAPVKNHRLFLDACRRVRRRRPDARFVVVGDGELAADLREQARHQDLDGALDFTGWRTDLADLYAALDVVVCCSINEGLPATLVEAGAAGRPVVATAVGGVPDVVTDGVNGRLVPSGDAEALAGAIEEVLADPELAARLGREGRRLAFARYGAQRLVDETEALYRRLLAPLAATQVDT